MRWSYELRYDPNIGFYALFWDNLKAGSPIADYAIIFGKVHRGTDMERIELSCVELCALA